VPLALGPDDRDIDGDHPLGDGSPLQLWARDMGHPLTDDDEAERATVDRARLGVGWTPCSDRQFGPVVTVVASVA
jgi:hypothetical protein